MILPISTVRRMALPLECRYIKETGEPVQYEVLPQRFFYRFILNGNVTSVSRRRFFDRLDFEERSGDVVNFGKVNGRAKIFCELVL